MDNINNFENYFWQKIELNLLKMNRNIKLIDLI